MRLSELLLPAVVLLVLLNRAVKLTLGGAHSDANCGVLAAANAAPSIIIIPPTKPPSCPKGFKKDIRGRCRPVFWTYPSTKR